MITLFCDFTNFRQKIGIFLKYQCYDHFFLYIFGLVLSQKCPFFLLNISAKIIASVPAAFRSERATF
jgi:hypothetical protein